jgi:sporulation protein YlmC with PRC-barrel domain
MIRNFLVTTVLATLVATAAYAQQAPAPAPAPEPPKPVQADGYLATNYIGESVYNGTGDNAQNIGNVNDILIDSKGMAKSIVVGVGGFLGIGEKNVAIDFPKLSWVEANGDRWLITGASKEQLEAAPAFDTSPYQPAPAPPAASGGATTTPPATTAPANTSQ